MSRFDSFDICAAYYQYAVGYNGEPYANEIGRRLDAIPYKPSRSEEYLCGLNENAREIYAALVEREHSTGYVHCACCGLDTIGVDGVAMCGYCEEAGCEPQCEGCPGCRGRSCQCPDEHDTEGDHDHAQE